ncbi:MAG: hypothetical protein ACFFCZ_17330 [Promethearchaeota archaeon]
MTQNDAGVLKRQFVKALMIFFILTAIGVIVLLSSLIFLQPEGLLLIGIVVTSFIIIMAGMAYAQITTVLTRNLFRALRVFNRNTIEQLIETLHFVLAKKDDIYMLATRYMPGIYFLKFDNLLETSETKIEVPEKVIRENAIEIDNVRVIKYEGTYTIPINETQYGTGQAILYLVFFSALARNRITIPRIIDKLYEETRQV